MQRDDMERDLLRATRSILSRFSKSNKFGNIDIDMEKKMREKLMDMSFDELESLYTLFKKSKSSKDEESENDDKKDEL